jgi:hypothetical protein
MSKKKLFRGEKMICHKCGWSFVSSNAVESQWTVIQFDDKLIYICPSCWGIPRGRWPQAVQLAWDEDHKK